MSKTIGINMYKEDSNLNREMTKLNTKLTNDYKNKFKNIENTQININNKKRNDFINNWQEIKEKEKITSKDIQNLKIFSFISSCLFFILMIIIKIFEYQMSTPFLIMLIIFSLYFILFLLIMSIKNKYRGKKKILHILKPVLITPTKIKILKHIKFFFFCFFIEYFVILISSKFSLETNNNFYLYFLKINDIKTLIYFFLYKLLFPRSFWNFIFIIFIIYSYISFYIGFFNDLSFVIEYMKNILISFVFMEVNTKNKKFENFLKKHRNIISSITRTYENSFLNLGICHIIIKNERIIFSNIDGDDFNNDCKDKSFFDEKSKLFSSQRSNTAFLNNNTTINDNNFKSEISIFKNFYNKKNKLYKNDSKIPCNQNPVEINKNYYINNYDYINYNYLINSTNNLICKDNEKQLGSPIYDKKNYSSQNNIFLKSGMRNLTKINYPIIENELYSNKNIYNKKSIENIFLKKPKGLMSDNISLGNKKICNFGKNTGQNIYINSPNSINNSKRQSKRNKNTNIYNLNNLNESYNDENKNENNKGDETKLRNCFTIKTSHERNKIQITKIEPNNEISGKNKLMNFNSNTLNYNSNVNFNSLFCPSLNKNENLQKVKTLNSNFNLDSLNSTSRFVKNINDFDLKSNISYLNENERSESRIIKNNNNTIKNNCNILRKESKLNINKENCNLKSNRIFYKDFPDKKSSTQSINNLFFKAEYGNSNEMNKSNYNFESSPKFKQNHNFSDIDDLRDLNSIDQKIFKKKENFPKQSFFDSNIENFVIKDTSNNHNKDFKKYNYIPEFYKKSEKIDYQQNNLFFKSIDYLQRYIKFNDTNFNFDEISTSYLMETLIKVDLLENNFMENSNINKLQGFSLRHFLEIFIENETKKENSKNKFTKNNKIPTIKIINHSTIIEDYQVNNTINKSKNEINNELLKLNKFEKNNKISEIYKDEDEHSKENKKNLGNDEIKDKYKKEETQNIDNKIIRSNNKIMDLKYFETPEHSHYTSSSNLNSNSEISNIIISDKVPSKNFSNESIYFKNLIEKDNNHNNIKNNNILNEKNNNVLNITNGINTFNIQSENFKNNLILDSVEQKEDNINLIRKWTIDNDVEISKIKNRNIFFNNSNVEEISKRLGRSSTIFDSKKSNYFNFCTTFAEKKKNETESGNNQILENIKKENKNKENLSIENDAIINVIDNLKSNSSDIAINNMKKIDKTIENSSYNLNENSNKNLINVYLRSNSKIDMLNNAKKEENSKIALESFDIRKSLKDDKVIKKSEEYAKVNINESIIEYFNLGFFKFKRINNNPIEDNNYPNIGKSIFKSYNNIDNNSNNNKNLKNSKIKEIFLGTMFKNKMTFKETNYKKSPPFSSNIKNSYKNFLNTADLSDKFFNVTLIKHKKCDSFIFELFIQIIPNYLLNISKGNINKKTSNKMEFQEENPKSYNQASLEIVKVMKKNMAKIIHEFKTPINTLISLISDLTSMDNLNSNKSHKILKLTNNISNYLVFLTKDIIQFCNIGANDNAEENLNFQKRQIKLNELILFCFDILKTLLKCKDSKANIEPILTFDNEIDKFYVITDELRLKQIILNFISNAIKFTKSGSIEIKCILKQKKKIKIYVKDTGIGIRDEEKEKLFNDFVMLKHNLNLNQHGSGLGLSICKLLAKKLNHQIKFKSKYNEGSCFYIILNCHKKFDKNLTHSKMNHIILPNRTRIRSCKFKTVYNLKPFCKKALSHGSINNSEYENSIECEKENNSSNGECNNTILNTHRLEFNYNLDTKSIKNYKKELSNSQINNISNMNQYMLNSSSERSYSQSFIINHFMDKKFSNKKFEGNNSNEKDGFKSYLNSPQSSEKKINFNNSKKKIRSDKRKDKDANSFDKNEIKKINEKRKFSTYDSSHNEDKIFRVNTKFNSYNKALKRKIGTPSKQISIKKFFNHFFLIYYSYFIIKNFKEAK